MRLALILVLGLSLLAKPSLAHKVVISAFAAGAAIEGEVGFSNGEMAHDGVVTVLDDAGQPLGQAPVDGQGQFRFVPVQAVPHLFRADLGSGHMAEIRLDLADLPVGLAGRPAEPVRLSPAPVPSDPRQDQLAEMIRREIKPLRQELAAYKEKNDLQTILGGIGYILGLFGLGFYLAARQRLKGR